MVCFLTRLHVLQHVDRTLSPIKLVVDTYSADDIAGVVKGFFSSDSVIIKVTPNDTKQYTLIPPKCKKGNKKYSDIRMSHVKVLKYKCI